MARQADLGLLGGWHRLEIPQQAAFQTTRLHVPAGWTMAGLTRLPLLMDAVVHVLLERLRVGAVTRHTQLVIIHVLRVGNDREIRS